MADDPEAREGTVSLPLSTSRETPTRRSGGIRVVLPLRIRASAGLHNIVDLPTGNIAKLLATIAMIVICIAWMFGYMDLRRGGFSIIGTRRHRTREHHRRADAMANSRAAPARDGPPRDRGSHLREHHAHHQRRLHRPSSRGRGLRALVKHDHNMFRILLTWVETLAVPEQHLFGRTNLTRLRPDRRFFGGR